MSSLAPPQPGATWAQAGERPWQAPVTVGGLAALGTAVLAVVDPVTTHVPLCPLKALTGLDCPFCGSLRAVHALTRFDVARALDHNAMFTLAVPALVICWTVWFLRSLGRPLPESWRLPARTTAVALAVALAFGVARNVPALAWLGSTA